jgi:hypothetical protein
MRGLDYEISLFIDILVYELTGKGTLEASGLGFPSVPARKIVWQGRVILSEGK